MIQLNEDSLITLFADMAKRMADYLKEVKEDPEYISQNKAYKMFGKNNIERWKKFGLITPRIEAGKMRYKTSILRKLQDIKQDYFNVPTLEQKRIARGK
jgi:hypothetical protein